MDESRLPEMVWVPELSEQVKSTGPAGLAG